ncbi:MAG: reverse transcriptase domain-containing protein [Eubacterium sp.]
MIALSQIANFSSLDAAFEQVLKRSKQAGMDGITPFDYNQNRKINLQELSWALKAGVYKASPIKQFSMTKKGKERELGILTCTDRIIATAIGKALSKAIEPLLSDNCYAYRFGKSALSAVAEVEKYIQGGYRFILKTDICDFFNTIAHTILLEKLKPYLDGDAMLDLITVLISAPTYFEGQTRERNEGLCLGSPLSPVLSNLYLMAFDYNFKDQEDYQYFRFADDLLVLSPEDNKVSTVLSEIKNELSEINLSLNTDKTQITEAEIGIDYLGFKLDANGIEASSEAEQALTEMLEDEWVESRELELEERLANIVQKLTFWNAYYHNMISGGMLGVVASIYKGMLSDEEIINYRQTLNDDNIEYTLLVADAWAARGHFIQALNEYEYFFGLRNFEPVSAIEELVQLYRRYFIRYDTKIMQEIINFYADEKCFNTADFLTRLIKRTDEDEMIDVTWEPIGYSEEEIEMYLDTFFQRKDIYGLEVMDEKERRVVIHEQEVQPDLIKRHLAGEITLDTCCFDQNGNTKFMVFDIDVSKAIMLQNYDAPEKIDQYTEQADEMGQKIVRLLEDYGTKAYLEDSGGAGRHIWAFLKQKTPYRKVSEFMQMIVDNTTCITESITVELFPPNRQIKISQRAPFIKVPFGRNVRTEKMSCIFDINGTRVCNWRQLSSSIVKNDTDSLLKNYRKVKKIDLKDLSLSDDFQRLGNLSPNVEQIINGCQIMRRICLKAVDTHFLNHFERLALLYVFGHLGDEGKLFLHYIIGKTMDYDEKVTNYFIGKLPESPVSCTKLREELLEFSGGKCRCCFKKPEGCYESPVLHALSIETYSVEDSDITFPVGRSKKEAEVVGYYDLKQSIEDKVTQLLEINKQIKGLEITKMGLKKEIASAFTMLETQQLETSYGNISVYYNGGEVKITLNVE